MTGLWGEALVVRALRVLGWDVQWEGGLTWGRDLRARREDRCLHVQVKCSTAADGRVHWRGPGDRAREWATSVESIGEGPTLFALVHMQAESETNFDLDRGVLTVLLPSDFVITVVSASRFASDVDAARRQYAARTRQVRGRHGEQVGQQLSADGLAYPVYVSDYPVLDAQGVEDLLT